MTSSSTSLAWYKFSAFFQMAALSISTLYPLFWKESLHFDEKEIGYLNAIATFIGLSSPLYFGQLGGKRALDRVILVCFLASACVALSMLGFQNFYWQLLLFAAFIFARTGFTTLAPVGVLNQLGDNAGQGYGQYRRFGSIGFLLGVIGTSYLIEIWPVQAMMWVTTGCLLIAAIPFFKKIRIPSHPGEAPPAYRQCFKNEAFKWLLISMMIVSTWWAAAFIYLPLTMKNVQANHSTIGWAVSICGIVAMIFLPMVGRWVDRINSSKILLIVPFFGALRIYCYSLPSDQALWFILIQLLHLPTWVVSEVTMMRILKNQLPDHLISRGQALLQVCQTLGMSVGAFLMATMLDYTDLKSAHQFFALCPLLAYPFILKLIQAKN